MWTPGYAARGRCAVTKPATVPLRVSDVILDEQDSHSDLSGRLTRPNGHLAVERGESVMQGLVALR
jgi:hypothetical protein